VPEILEPVNITNDDSKLLAVGSIDIRFENDAFKISEINLRPERVKGEGITVEGLNSIKGYEEVVSGWKVSFDLDVTAEYDGIPFDHYLLSLVAYLTGNMSAIGDQSSWVMYKKDSDGKYVVQVDRGKWGSGSSLYYE